MANLVVLLKDVLHHQCENPRQIANICCPVCDIDEDNGDVSSELDLIIESPSRLCPELQYCSLSCEHGLVKDDHGCSQCLCSSLSCPMPYCTLKFNRFSRKEFCSCSSYENKSCPSFNCDKHCPYNYTIDERTGCPSCACNPCPPLICTKNCTYGLKQNEIGCPLCVCESRWISKTEQIFPSWSRQCQSGQYSYSNGEIWFDGCRQCLCYKGQTLCALISCPVPKCPQPIFLPNRCCPSCPGKNLSLSNRIVVQHLFFVCLFSLRQFIITRTNSIISSLLCQSISYWRRITIR